MKRPKKQGSRRHMTPLERGLAICGRRAGMTWEALADVFHRDVNTLRRSVKDQALMRNAQSIRKEMRTCPPCADTVTR